MNEVRINKNKLQVIVKKNRDAHRAIFLKAQGEYRKRAIEVLDEQLRLAREGAPFVLARFYQLVTPEDHTADYDRALKMLELSVDKVITLSAADFANLVEDQWGWSRSWAASNVHYVDDVRLHSLAET
jgi:hypothetical protein